MNTTDIQVMVDIETLSKRKTAALLSIGAVKFNATEIIDTFYVNIDPTTCKKYNFHFCPDTIKWWGEQNKEARDALRIDRKSVEDGLQLFSEWFGPKSLPTWGNGASFDNVILENAYYELDMKLPWKFWDERCFRTFKSVFKVTPPDRIGAHHNALDDAITQTLHLQKIFAGAV